MANYSLILNAPFKPFSYQEMVAPVLAATQAHQAVEEDYANLAAAANTVAGKANEQTDPYAYKMYKTYADDLANRADQLLRYGLNATSRRDMLNMRARYGNEIAPIDAAYKRREALADEQRKMSAQNPTMLYEKEAKYMSLDDFIKNPSLDYGNSYSGALLAQQVGQAAANIAKEARDSEEGRRQLRRILPYQYEVVQRQGFSREAVMKAILNSPDADKILTGLVESAITTSGVGHLDEYGNPTADGWGDLQTRRRAYDYARQGLWNAIGQTQYQMVTDEYGIKSALEARAARRQKEAEDAAKLQSNRLNPVAVRDQHDVGKASQLKKWMDKGYIKESAKTPGRYVLTVAGFEALKKGNKLSSFSDATNMGLDALTLTHNPMAALDMAKKIRKNEEEKSFSQFMQDNIHYEGPAYTVTKGGHEVVNPKMGDALTNFVNSTKEGSYDIYHTTEYKRQLSDEYGKEVMRQLIDAAPERGYSIVHFDSKTRTWKSTEDPIKITDLKNPTATSLNYSRMGTTAIIHTKDSKGKITGQYRILVPQLNMNPTMATDLQNSISNADDFGAILAKGRKPEIYYDVEGNMRYKKDENGDIIFTNIPLTQADIKKLENKQDRELGNMGIFGSQLVVPSSTKDEQYEVINF